LDEEIKSSYANNRTQTTLLFTAIGGESGTLTDSSDKNAIETWKNSIAGYDKISTNKTALIGFGADLGGLIPLYELASNQTRRDEIKAVMNGEGFVTVEYEDKSNYQIEVPVFSVGVSETLVKDVKDSNNRVIATVCNEFIPEINPTKRVNVIYPVASGKILIHAGFFPGYEGRRPARISWNGSNLKIVDYEELEEKEYSNLFLGGVTVKTKFDEYKTPKQTTIHDSYLSAVHFNDTYHNYPLVKIFGDIWTREDYRSNKYGNWNSMRIKNLEIKDTHIKSMLTQACVLGSGFYYKRSVVNDDGFAPSGWQVSSSKHYKEIQAMLTKYNLNSGLSFRSNPNSPGHSPLGYEAPTSEDDGWINIDTYETSDSKMFLYYHYGGKENRYWTNDGYHVRVNDSGFAVETIDDNSRDYYKDPSCFLSVRLIKKN
jgi:hypothetical protein